MKDKNNILKRPLVTEKMTIQGEQLNRYAFIVQRRANKLSIKKAVEEMYGVSVETVRTMTMPGKARSRFTKSGITKGQTQARKKAIVTLVKGDTIDFFSNI